MALRRQKLDRKVQLTLDAEHVIDMPPGWVFTIDCPYHGKIDFDFNTFRENGREELAAQMRDTIWSLRHESVGASLTSVVMQSYRNLY